MVTLVHENSFLGKLDPGKYRIILSLTLAISVFGIAPGSHHYGTDDSSANLDISNLDELNSPISKCIVANTNLKKDSNMEALKRFKKVKNLSKLCRKTH